MTIAAVEGPQRSWSSRALLFTVLGEYVRDLDGAVWTSTLLTALGVLGVSPRAARQAVTRAGATGWIMPIKQGRRLRWELSDSARRHFADSAAEAYGRRRQLPAWDGQWYLVLTTVPEDRRDLRHRLRTRLRWAGFGPLGQGAWVSPRPDASDAAARILGELGLHGNALAFVGAVGNLGSEYQLVRTAWDLGELARRYGTFVNELRTAAPRTPVEHFVQLTQAVHQWRWFLLNDPALPAAVLPARWPGHEARTLFFRCHCRWSATARAWLNEIDGEPPRDAEEASDASPCRPSE